MNDEKSEEPARKRARKATAYPSNESSPLPQGSPIPAEMYNINLDFEEEGMSNRKGMATNELRSVESADDLISLDAPSLSRWMRSTSFSYTPQSWSPISSVQPKSSESDSALSPISGLSSLQSVEPLNSVPESFSE